MSFYASSRVCEEALATVSFNLNPPESPSTWTLQSNQVVQEPSQNEYYLLLSGCIRINYVNQKGESTFIRLVLPGDYLGVERFTESQLSVEYITITPCSIQREFAVNSELPADVLKTVLIQSYKRCKDVVAYLRCGSAQERLTHLLMMMVSPEHQQKSNTTERACLMPSIKDMANIVDVAPESISRTIANLKKDNILANRKRFTANLNLSLIEPMVA